jgi:hypothetical protein
MLWEPKKYDVPVASDDSGPGEMVQNSWLDALAERSGNIA